MSVKSTATFTFSPDPNKVNMFVQLTSHFLSSNENRKKLFPDQGGFRSDNPSKNMDKTAVKLVLFVVLAQIKATTITTRRSQRKCGYFPLLFTHPHSQRIHTYIQCNNLEQPLQTMLQKTNTEHITLHQLSVVWVRDRQN